MKKIMKTVYLALLYFLILSAVGTSFAAEWHKPTIIPMPDMTEGVKRPIVSLNGTWKFTLNPADEYWKNSVDPTSWSDVTVPGEPWMHGLRIKRDKEYPYKKKINIPADFAGKTILLRFDGVYSVGRVWVNGKFAGEHYGGFQSWNLDITHLVEAGKDAWITVGIEDLTKDLSFASGYASRYLGVNDVPHHIGGILRNVSIIAVPKTHISSLHYITDLDDDYQNAELKIHADIMNTGKVPQKTKIKYTLFKADEPNKPLLTCESSVLNTKPSGKSTDIRVFKVSSPLLWDAEHPHLYTLKAEVVADGKSIETLSRKVGFREIEIRGTELLVNGKRIKMRGGCRHNVHPTMGRAYVPELAEKDIRLYKEANINYIRTSHYPTTQHFLDLCDQYGMYVEEEMAIVWLDHNAAKGILNGLASAPQELPYFMRAISETLERDKSHPSIIMWSLGNENVKWGKNFEQERNYARKEDPTRPLKTGHNHYKGGWDTVEHCDIDSMHYPKWNTKWNSIKSGKPYLADEYVHVMCYYSKNSFSDRDPNVRNFWGECIKKFWDEMYPSKTVLGAAIWGTIDEVFLCPERALGYGRWGIFDGWRRKKPEFWHTRKAYSPIRIENKALGNPGKGQPLKIPVKNWFDHTDFNELDIEWQVGVEKGRIKMDLAPAGSAGTLTIPGIHWKDSDIVKLRFNAHHPVMGKRLIDEFNLPLSENSVERPTFAGSAPKMREAAGKLLVTGEQFRIEFDKAKGQISSASCLGEELIIGGPFVNLTPVDAPFKASSFKSSAVDGAALIQIQGKQGEVKVNFAIRIGNKGVMSVEYSIPKFPAGRKTKRKERRKPQKSKYEEIGVSFVLSPKIDRLSWQRNGLWSTYPDNHIGRSSGKAIKTKVGKELKYREEPQWPWYHDMKDFHQYGKDHKGYGMTHDFRGSKEYIYEADLYSSGGKTKLRVISDGKRHAVRLAQAPSNEKSAAPPIVLNINREWTYNPKWGCHSRVVPAQTSFRDTVYVTFDKQ